MPKLSEHLEKFFQERLEQILKALDLGIKTAEGEETVWTINHSRSAISDVMRYHLDRLVNMRLVEKNHSGRNILNWKIRGPANLPELIEDQIKKLSRPVASNEELENIVLEQAEEIRRLKEITKQQGELLDIVIKANDPPKTTNPVVLEIHGRNTIEDIIAILQTGRANAIRKAFANFLLNLAEIQKEFCGLKDQGISELIKSLQPILNGEGSKSITTARKELNSWKAAHSGRNCPSLEVIVKTEELLLELIQIHSSR